MAPLTFFDIIAGAGIGYGEDKGNITVFLIATVENYWKFQTTGSC